MEESSGIIKNVRQGGSEGIVTEEGSNADLDFINPRIPSISVGERYSFLKIIQNTPNGSQVINILKGKMP